MNQTVTVIIAGKTQDYSMRSYRVDEILCTPVKTGKGVNEQDANEEIAKRDKRIAELIADYSRTSEAMFA